MAVHDQVVAAQRGDPLAMAALLGELAPWVGRICGAIALDKGDDALQETLIVVLKNLPTLREPAALRAWVRRIAVRESLRLVTGRREVPVADIIHAGVATADLDLRADVRAVLETLPVAHRAVLVLRHVEDLSEDETAEVLGVEPGTVKSRGHRARAAFAARWRP